MIKEEKLISVLEEWNPWKKKIDSGIRREEYVKKLFGLVKRKEILVLKGIRRCGKSTIMKQLMKELIKNGVGKTQILYLNLEDYAFKDSLKIELLEKTLEVYLKHTKNRKTTYYFIDEIQNISGWERFLRTKYDAEEKIRFIVSGSNASLLSKELSTLLTGRNLTFQIRTLSLSEFYKFSKKGKIEEFLTYGGFPEVVLEQDDGLKRLLLQQYFEDIINKDIIARHNIRNVELVFNLARHILANSGGKVSMNRLGKTFGVTDDTIATYLSYMLDAYLAIKIPFFSYSLKTRHSVLAQPKYYASDNGLMHISSLNFSEDIGRKYENTVLLKIYESKKDIAYWAKKGEVDFVYGNKAVNVTAARTVPEREYEGLAEFKKYHKKFDLLLVREKPDKGEREIAEVSLEDFCLEPLGKQK